MIRMAENVLFMLLIAGSLNFKARLFILLAGRMPTQVYNHVKWFLIDILVISLSLLKTIFKYFLNLFWKNQLRKTGFMIFTIV
uniref:Uncharacterized protein n=1 Tax=Arsenophonus nasoniae TaxID=638 RepID=D2U165_9GAMM|nr:hypothetical protein ARN_22720 [Arsenophonus nasoniae]